MILLSLVVIALISVAVQVYSRKRHKDTKTKKEELLIASWRNIK